MNKRHLTFVLRAARLVWKVVYTAGKQSSNAHPPQCKYAG